MHVGVHHTFELGVFELNNTHKHGQSQSNGHLPETINFDSNNCGSEKWEIQEYEKGTRVSNYLYRDSSSSLSAAAPSAVERSRINGITEY